MKIQKILDSIYLIPVILDHLDNPTDLTADILYENGITDSNLNELNRIKHLLEYHHHAIQSNFRSNYPLLRTGLKEYFDIYLSGIFQKLKVVDKQWMCLDYGCGEAQISKQFLKDNPESEVILMDKDNPNGMKMIQVNFEREPTWYKPFKNYFDLIILSEVLHCKTKVFQEYLVNSSYQMLKKKGKLLIIENTDNCMGYRIGKIKQGAYNPLKPADIDKLVKPYDMKIRNLVTINLHTAYYYEKV